MNFEGMRSKRLLSVLSAAMFGLLAPNVDAAVINTSGGVLSFTASNIIGNGVNVSATGKITASVVSGNLELAVILNNTTNLLNVGDNTAIMSFGFGINPNATGVSLVNTTDNGTAGGGGDLNSAALVTQQGSSNIPSLANLEICAFGVLNGNCSGGSVNEGVQAGESDAFKLVLTGTWGSTADIAPLGFKFQGTYGSYEFYGTFDQPPVPPGGGRLPEPATGLLVLAAAGLGMRAATRKASRAIA